MQGVPWRGLFFFSASVLVIPGCSILFPDASAPKSGTYQVTPPGDPWKSVPVGETMASVDALKADLAYEDTRTGAIISLNSICRKYQKASLDELSRNLVLGIKDKQVIRERETTVGGAEAKDTLIQGEVEGARVQIRTVVLKKNSCTYDLIHVASPEKAESTEKDFEAFVTSLQVE